MSTSIPANTRVTKPSVDDTLNYDRLIDMPFSILEELVKDCEKAIEETRTDIVRNYEQAKPFLLKMRTSKTRLRQLAEKTEAYKAFLSTGRDGSLVSQIDIATLRKNFPELNSESPSTISPHVTIITKTPIKKLSKTTVLKTPPMKSRPVRSNTTVLVRDKYGQLVPKK